MSLKKNLILLCFSYVFLILPVFGQQYPLVNCPEVFKYAYDLKYGGHYGLVTVKKDESSISEIQINMSVNAQEHVYSNIQIITLSRTEDFFYKDSILKYAVRFPIQRIVPKLLLLQFNNRILCHGTADPLIPGTVQTHMWAKSTVTTYGPFQSTQVFTQTSTEKQEVASSHQSMISFPAISTTKLPYQCGLFGGGAKDKQQSSAQNFPWLAAVVYKQNSDYKFQCAGNLVSDKHVITAGTCVQNVKQNPTGNNDFFILLGKLDAKTNPKDSTVRKARDIVVHPNFKDKSADSNIAIIFLSEPVIFTPTIGPICLWNGKVSEPVIFTPTIGPICLWNGKDDLDDIVGKMGTFVGWGQEQETRKPRNAELPIVSKEQCLKSNKIFQEVLSSAILCAGLPDNTNKLCADNTGAGLILKDNISEKWFLRGVVTSYKRDPISFSCDLAHYAIFTDVAKSRRWIEKEMGKY
ncbi:Serine protease gd N-terminus [Popillia japonica]|uniref:Serine protease gd N-terminus n=1 Tax=Popillia japonica TaxID=7064 RepID=A0AAW1L8R0_POPJA